MMSPVTFKTMSAHFHDRTLNDLFWLSRAASDRSFRRDSFAKARFQAARELVNAARQQVNPDGS